MAARHANKRSAPNVARTALLALCVLCATLAALARPPLAAAASTSASGGVGGTAGPPSGGSAAPGKGGAPHSNSPAKAKTNTKAEPKPKAKAPKPKGVTISGAACVPAIHCSTNPHQVSAGGELLIQGTSLSKGMVVAFPHSWDARIASNSPTARLASSTQGLIVHVPNSAHSGHIMVVLSHGRHSNSYGPIQVVAYALHPPTPPPPVDPVGGTSSPTAFESQGMWIWYLEKSDGGDLASIVAQAHAAGVSTLYVKSSDGPTNYWSQFSPELVAQLHANGLRVCAWQYVYGSEPAGEAALGAEAVADGADCLVIDAESEYEGRYGAAQTYIADLRAKIGPSYPLGLASFPYVYDHTSFPYSVFLGPNGAQFDVPQMYWKDIGDSVDTVYANTYISNRIYDRPIFPLGQTYGGVSSAEIVRFREEAPLYGASGISFWDFQEASATDWTALAEPLAPLSEVTPNPSWSELSEGSRGDPVLWMQEHLAAAIPTQVTTGIFEATTKTNLEQFQTAHGIAPSGVTEAATWQALLALTPVTVNWTGAGPKG